MKLDNRIWYLVTAVVCIALIAGGVFLGVQPQLGAIATASSDKANVDAQLVDLRSQISGLTEASKKKNELDEQAAEIRKKLPAGVDGAAFIAELTDISGQSGASVSSLDVSTPVAYAPPAAPAAPADPAAASASPSASPSASASATAAAPSAAAADVPLTKGAVTAANFVVIKVTIALAGTHDQVLDFIKRLQNGNRLILLTGVTLTQEESGTTTASLDGSIYALSNTVANTAPAATPANG
ncbi:hypothetical protein GCM10027515_15320 [Schumannella luteola]|uniref:Tfp pilus assembly protein PilO n=1 Tax=Schumannella luteola TaxID=472059 RepID=A0A852YNC6_9MICO|nr:hypothetical protein [Schumannella luteola]NYH00669.1 Tfp pilus assembly protein PilO [Schumannella luteola]TPX04494.1 hypothetical protein FJ656_11540 [Schumannella luteola]